MRWLGWLGALSSYVDAVSIRAFIASVSRAVNSRNKRDKDRTNVYGYFLEVEPTQIARLPDCQTARPFFRKPYKHFFGMPNRFVGKAVSLGNLYPATGMSRSITEA